MPDENVLVRAAKKAGAAAGKVAAMAGVTGEQGSKARAGKLPPKNKSRLPRKQKKAQLKGAGSATRT